MPTFAIASRLIRDRDFVRNGSAIQATSHLQQKFLQGMINPKMHAVFWTGKDSLRNPEGPTRHEMVDLGNQVIQRGIPTLKRLRLLDPTKDYQVEVQREYGAYRTGQVHYGTLRPHSDVLGGNHQGYLRQTQGIVGLISQQATDGSWEGGERTVARLKDLVSKDLWEQLASTDHQFLQRALNLPVTSGEASLFNPSGPELNTGLWRSLLYDSLETNPQAIHTVRVPPHVPLMSLMANHWTLHGAQPIKFHHIEQLNANPDENYRLGSRLMTVVPGERLID